MKYSIRYLVILALACAICIVVSFHFGFNRGKRFQRGTFVVSFNALENLRAGKTDEAINKMEALCFGSAEMLYSDPAYRNETVTSLYAKELKEYRATYRKDTNQWSPAELQLEKDLVNWK